MKEYNFKWIRFLWETSFTVFVFWFGYKLLMIPLTVIQITEGTDKLIWVVILGLMCFAIKFRIPPFFKFYGIRRYEEEE